LWQLAAMIRIEMHHHDEGSARLLRECLEEPLQGCHAARGRSDRDNGRLRWARLCFAIAWAVSVIVRHSTPPFRRRQRRSLPAHQGCLSSRCGCVSDNPRYKISIEPYSTRRVPRGARQGVCGVASKFIGTFEVAQLKIAAEKCPTMRLIYLAPSHPLADLPRSPQIVCKGREGAEYGVVDTSQTSVARAQVTQGASAVGTGARREAPANGPRISQASL